MADFYQQIGDFLSIALIAVVIGVLNAFYQPLDISLAHRDERLLYGALAAATTCRRCCAARTGRYDAFSSTLQDWGVSLIQAVMTLVAFLPVLVGLSQHVKACRSTRLMARCWRRCSGRCSALCCWVWWA